MEFQDIQRFAFWSVNQFMKIDLTAMENFSVIVLSSIALNISAATHC
jgi:hypothetical protein